MWKHYEKINESTAHYQVSNVGFDRYLQRVHNIFANQPEESKSVIWSRTGTSCEPESTKVKTEKHKRPKSELL